MKKLLLALLAGAMILATAACTGDPEVPGEEVVEANTVGTKLAQVFKENAETAESNEALANTLITDLPFMAGVVPMEEGFLSGFDNYEVKGFSEAYMFGPMMGSIAFVGYVFELPEGADVEAFKTGLSENANLRWNICVEAEEMVIENVGNKVFFVMCPKSFEEPDAGADEFDEGLADETVDEIPAADEEPTAADEEAEILPPVADDGEEENLDNEISADSFEVVDEK